MKKNRLKTAAQKPLTLTSLFVIFLIGAQFPLWLQVSQEVERWHEQRSHKRQVAALRERNEKNAVAFEKEADSLSELETVAPSLRDLTSLVEDLERTGVLTGVQVDFVNIVEDATAGDQPRVGVLRVTANVSGSPTALLSYLDAVENRSELTQVPSWQLSRTISGEVDVYVLTIDLNAYVLKQGYGEQGQ